MRISSRDAKIGPNILRSQNGQGIVEAVLLLMVAVLIILGSVYQFNDAFRIWAKNYFGDYLSCLLETGELPSIGGTGGGAGSCNALYQPYSLAKGRPYIGQPGEGSGDGSGGNSSSENGGKSRGAEGQTNTAYVKVGGAGAGPAFGGTTGKSGAANSSGGDGGGGGRNKPAYTGSTESSTPGWATTGTRRSATNKSNGLDNGFFVSRNERESEDTRQSMSKTSAQSGDAKRNQHLKVQRKPTAAAVDDNEEEMGFGDWLRYLLMAAIIIALVVVVGGQLFQISKEMD